MLKAISFNRSVSALFVFSIFNFLLASFSILFHIKAAKGYDSLANLHNIKINSRSHTTSGVGFPVPCGSVRNHLHVCHKPSIHRVHRYLASQGHRPDSQFAI